MKREERAALYGAGRAYWTRLGADVRGSIWLYLLLIPGVALLSCVQVPADVGRGDRV